MLQITFTPTDNNNNKNPQQYFNVFMRMYLSCPSYYTHFLQQTTSTPKTGRLRLIQSANSKFDLLHRGSRRRTIYLFCVCVDVCVCECLRREVHLRWPNQFTIFFLIILCLRGGFFPIHCLSTLSLCFSHFIIRIPAKTIPLDLLRLTFLEQNSTTKTRRRKEYKYLVIIITVKDK